MSRAFILLIRCYQVLVSPLLPVSCRFHPSCSHYALQAFQHHGVLWGLWLSAARVVKCQPLHAGGIDPVPERPGMPWNIGHHPST